MARAESAAPEAPAGKKAPGPASSGGRIAATLKLLIVPALAILTALIIGALIIVLSNPDTLASFAYFFSRPTDALSLAWADVSGAYSALFQTSLGSPEAISETIVAMTPLIFAGLSVALGFQAGLFNIGGEGQIIVGSLFAVFVGFSFTGLPLVVHLPLALAAGALGGAIWGFIPGILKARTGAHEVITTIMLNYVALYLGDYLLGKPLFQRPSRSDPISKVVETSAQLPQIGELRVNLGIVLALAAAFGVWWLLYKTTAGFEMRAVGASPSAATYAGMSVAGTYVIVMSLAGALAGLGGTSNVLGIQHSLFPGFTGYGFDAIALALLGRSHPFGVVAAAFLFGVLRAGSVGMQAATATPVDIIVVIQALIIAFVAAPALVRAIYRVRVGGGAQESFTRGWST